MDDIDKINDDMIVRQRNRQTERHTER